MIQGVRFNEFGGIKILEKLPEIIQGGMGAGVSNWRLAKVVSQKGQIGVVSGTALEVIIARRLQVGDVDGSIRRALSHFPWPDLAKRVLDTYFIPGGKSTDEPFKLTTTPTLKMKRACMELMVIGNFVEVFLAKEGHNGLVGINYLEKIQLPTLPSLFGAILGGVDFIIMGAGIPISIPGILDGLSRWEKVELKLFVEDNPQHFNYKQHFNPKDYFPGELPKLSRPKFLAIVSSDIIAKIMTRKATGCVDGFIVENHTAGGHNAPPRKDDSSNNKIPLQFGKKDIPDLTKINKLGKPFWLAGGYASPGKLHEALNSGAAGIQVGTIFAYCNESGIMPEIKQEVLQQYIKGELQVVTDFHASPTGYPFKLIKLNNTITSIDMNQERERICDLCYLRQLYSKGESEIGYRCPAEPVSNYVLKGGNQDETVGKQCLCNGLLATIGLGQIRKDGNELPAITAGEDFSFVKNIIKNADLKYSAADVLDYLKS